MSGFFDPLQNLLLMQEQLRTALKQVVDSTPRSTREGKHWVPAADLWKTPGMLFIDVEIPGTPLESIRLDAEGDELVLSGSRPMARESEDSHFRRMEGEYGEFRRVFSLPKGADFSRVEATLSSGVLEIRVPLGEPDRENRVIEPR